MKAITYIEFEEQLYQDNDIIPGSRSKSGKLIKHLFGQDSIADTELRAFYLQPFKPEKIPFWFKGWKKDDIKLRFYNKFNFTLDFINENYFRIWKPNSIIRIIDTPSTLYQFISNCQQAGIELVFQKGIGKEFLPVCYDLYEIEVENG